MGALTNVYVDPSIAGDSGTGTIGDPYGDLQYALNTMTRDATNGDQINIKAGTAEILAASLSLTTYGAPAEGVPLVLRGYTSAANDGGIAEINSNGNTFLAVTTHTDVGFVDLKIHNFGNANGVVDTGLRTFMVHCEVYKGVATPSGKTLVSGINFIANCYIHDAGTTGTGIGDYRANARNNYVYNCLTGISAGPDVANNLIVDCTTAGISVTADNYRVIGNTIYSSSAATGSGILAGSGISGTTIINNTIVGYSGAGGKGISHAADIAIIGYNAFYNNTTNESLADVMLDLGNDAEITGATSPFTNAAGGDFSLNTAVVGAIDGAFPGTWYGPASTTDHADIGAVQNGAGAGGGTVNPLRGKLG